MFISHLLKYISIMRAQRTNIVALNAYYNIYICIYIAIALLVVR